MPSFLGLFYSVIFLTFNGHHQILRVLSESFEIVIHRLKARAAVDSHFLHEPEWPR